MTLPCILQLLSFSLILNADMCFGAVPPCGIDWFGSPCRYKCHCVKNSCDKNGECIGSSTCERGWFGPACQYVDLVATNTTSTTPAWVYDYPDTLCNTGQDTVTVILQDAFYFTWLRLRVNTTGTSATFKLQFISSNGITTDCTNMQTTAVSDAVLDIQCDTNAWYQQLVITGNGAKSVCAVYISGGRNVALRQDTSQTSIFDGMDSGKAVDGNTDSNYAQGSCTHTSKPEQTQSWTLTFQRPHKVIRYNLYNRNTNKERLQGFTMEAVQETGSVAFSYTDTNTNILDVYRIQSEAPQTPVSSVKISAVTHYDKYYVTLCEVEMFGEVVCPAGNYGRDCENDCHCAGAGETCFVSTGGCPSGCAAGYQGQACGRPCNATYYGEKCAQRCNTSCKDQDCDPVNGNCQSCVAGKSGQQCDKDCYATYYGENCSTRCSTNCKDWLCDPVHGNCHSCVAGKIGQLCDQTCNATYYGENCVLRCRSNCKDWLCDPVNGNCQSCVPGKAGQICDRDCNATYYGDNCAQRCNISCKDQLCDPENGNCQSCVAGKSGHYCDKACDAKFYGENCAQNCSSNCMNQLCDPVNGDCQSCVAGKTGQLCDQACPPTTFGEDCRENCSTNCTDQFCDAITGTCISCVQGSTGDLCDAMLQVQPHVDAPAHVAAIVGPVIAFVVLVTLIVIGVLMWRRRGHKKDATTDDTFQDGVDIESKKNNAKPKVLTKYKKGVNVQQANPSVMKQPKLGRASKDGQESQVDCTYYNILSCRSETAIRFSELDKFMTEHRKEFYREQFNLIPANSTATTTIALSAENQNKNRYKNISAYDHSRVHLQTDPAKLCGDYINASYVDGYQHKRQFIASQGPTKIILEDFVRMLWEQEVQVVVMLTNLIEDGKLKCEQYWPNDGEINIGEITVKLTTTQVFADYTVRRLCLYKTPQPVRILTHFHFTTWPDKDVPTTAWGLVDLEQRVASIATSKPIVVHCSAGVGRTGTFIALHNILEEIKHTGYVDAFKTVQKLREDRMNMVQNVEQYEFLHKATQIAMVCMDTTVASGNIQDRIQFLEEKSEADQTNLEKEFKSVCLVCADDECDEEEEGEVQENNTYCNSRILSNRMKNRLHNVLPKEYYRPILSCEHGDVENSYINAVLIPSSKKRDHQILTQLPLPTTVVDFWRLVTQYKVSLIVAFELDLSTEDVTIGPYLPEGEADTKLCSLFNVKASLLDSCDAWQVQRVTVVANEGTTPKSMNVSFKGEYSLSHLSWKSKDLDPQTLLTLLEKIRAMKPAGEGRTLYTCRNGAEWSGLAYTLSLLLDRMDNDQHVSVPLVVGTVKAIRPQIVPTLDQYRLLYQVLNFFNERNNVYGNVSPT